MDTEEEGGAGEGAGEGARAGEGEGIKGEGEGAAKDRGMISGAGAEAGAGRRRRWREAGEREVNVSGEVAVRTPYLGSSTSLLNGDNHAVYYRGMPRASVREHAAAAAVGFQGYAGVAGAASPAGGTVMVGAPLRLRGSTRRVDARIYRRAAEEVRRP